MKTQPATTRCEPLRNRCMGWGVLGRSVSLTEPERKLLTDYSDRTQEATFETLAFSGTRFSIAQGVVNTVLTLVTDELEFEDSATNVSSDATGVVMWLSWAVAGVCGFRVAVRIRRQGPLIIYICLTTLLIAVITARRFVAIDTLNALCASLGRSLPSAADDLGCDDRGATVAVQLSYLFKAVTTSLPLYAAMAALFKLQGEHALLASVQLGA